MEKKCEQAQTQLKVVLFKTLVLIWPIMEEFWYLYLSVSEVPS